MTMSSRPMSAGGSALPTIDLQGAQRRHEQGVQRLLFLFPDQRGRGQENGDDGQQEGDDPGPHGVDAAQLRD